MTKKLWLQSLRENLAYEPISGRIEPSNCFYLAGVENGKWHIGSHYPTQAKVRLEWGTQHLLPVWQKLC